MPPAQANPLYFPQLQAALTYPQAVGIIGGRPGSSLFFVGYQGQHLLYLDPHTVQPAAPLPAAGASYFCGAGARLMPIASMDPSVAIGFYCRDAGGWVGRAGRGGGGRGEWNGAWRLGARAAL